MLVNGGLPTLELVDFISRYYRRPVASKSRRRNMSPGFSHSLGRRRES